jgi:ketosteroid isomerase-like protein
MPTVVDLERRLQALEDEKLIIETFHRYTHAIDYGDEAGWVDCFTPDGVFEVRSRHAEPTTKRITGREELAAFVSQHTRAPELWHKHIVLQSVVDLDGDSATCMSYMAALVDHDDSPHIKVFGRYDDRVTRCADGRWRIAYRIAEVESSGPGLPRFAYGRSR